MIHGRGTALECSVKLNQNKNKGKDQGSIQSSTTPDPGYQWEIDNFTIRHNKRQQIELLLTL